MNRQDAKDAKRLSFVFRLESGLVRPSLAPGNEGGQVRFLSNRYFFMRLAILASWRLSPIRITQHAN